MTRLLTWFAVLVLLASCAAVPERVPRFDGITYARMPAVAIDAPQEIHVLAIDLTRPGISLEVTAGDRSGGMEYRAQTVSEFVARNGLQAAVNGGFFEPFRGGVLDTYPRSGDPVRALGLSMHAGEVVSPAQEGPRVDGRMNGTVCIRKPVAVTIERAQACPPRTDEALAAGPLLLSGGAQQPHALTDVRHPRTAFGLSADRRTAWMVVVDGRQPRSAGATLQELVEIFRRLGASDALNFDGGGSSAMVVEDAAWLRALNAPIHTGVIGRERPGANQLGVRARAPP